MQSWQVQLQKAPAAPSPVIQSDHPLGHPALSFSTHQPPRDLWPWIFANLEPREPVPLGAAAPPPRHPTVPPARTVAARARTLHQDGEWRKGNGLGTRAHIPRRRPAPPTELRSRQGQAVHDPTRQPARLARVSSFDVPQPFLARPPATIDAVDAQFLPA
ncbi:hypothetical protein CDV36_014892 [Fusarium kuroshium]|uniref:Uncharacterized protein n=1 Tax=Fusarium kuroshium TaxID=2010991 RepID=A0A3M2RE43_9HYPO|nr:hypothetical protein CDV36_014892 [Fusarium kuroshium]